MGNTRRLRTILLTSCASTCAALLAGELVMRYRAHRKNQETFEAAYSEPRPLRPRGRVALVDILQPSRNEQIIYELRPNLLHVPFKRVSLTTNSHGFRSAEYPIEKGPSDVVVIGIGDSTQFGHGVADGQPYLSVLEKLLNRSHPERTWKVINTGVPGYNTTMEVETLRTKGLQFKPDLVILDLVLNDLELPVYLQSEQDVLDPHHSFLADLVRERLGSRPAGFSSGSGFSLVATPEALIAQVDPSPDEIAAYPPRYRNMLGMSAFERALDKLAALSREHGFRVVAWSLGEFAEPVPRLIQAARARGFLVTSILDELRAYTEQNYHMELSVENETKTRLVVGPGNAHPSALAHKMAAQKMAAFLEESGLVRELSARGQQH